jgi:predicted GNAT family N-acyltransferase
MLMGVIIREIEASETAHLRQKVLRPHQTLEEMKYPNDLVDKAFHLGAFENDHLVGIVSAYPETKAGQIDQANEWRIRGMATEPSVRGKGYGKLLVEKSIELIRDKGGKEVWCNARTPACGFYLKFGFQKVGEEFEIEGIGPHYIMEISLTN